MAKDRDHKERGGGGHGDKKMCVGVIWNCAAELKLLLGALFILCSVVTVLQFLPSRFTISPTDLRLCLSKISTATTTTATAISNDYNDGSSSYFSILPSPSPSPPYTAAPPPPPAVEHEQILNNSILKRAFNPYGAAAYNFITMGAYRGGPNTFAVVGLSSKPLHVFGKPVYECEWVPKNNPENFTFAAQTYKILPDWGYGRVYTVVVVNCTFSVPINVDNTGGSLFLHASTSGGGDTKFNLTDRILSLEEKPDSVDFSIFSASSKPKYDYLYCGSSLYGSLSPQRMREWIAYHVRLFGEKSHFVIHDAGGVHEEVLEVLKPWMELGYVTLQDIRDQERFDGYYHNQFLVVNDCLHRYKHMAKWMFFFDVDEFIYVPSKQNIKSVIDSQSDFTQFTIEQNPMSGQLCAQDDYGKAHRRWGFEKLVYKDVKRGIRRDRKYAIQPRNVFATGVHMSMNLQGRSNHKTMMRYFHYHGTIAKRTEPCRNYVNWTRDNFENKPYVLDTTLRNTALAVKKFEYSMIGSRLQNTRQ
ncbi:hypothetical protein Dsin_028659 [Dipteronia sinensis]|uniref:Glycosyltransferase family 92 protein n=1 Tax=Dipteronia sinensis TaxID=43782 RepID=A0AAE0DUH0_9ROSI|nr:hypothetical protein Dsin_028659 [Dipteronia sinensis]